MTCTPKSNFCSFDSKRVYQFFVSIGHFIGKFNTKIVFCFELIKFITIFSIKSLKLNFIQHPQFFVACGLVAVQCSLESIGVNLKYSRKVFPEKNINSGV